MKISSYEIQVPFVTSSADSVKALKELATNMQGKLAADLGSGDGKIVLALVKLGLISHGYETNETLVKRARQLLQERHLQDKAFIYQTSFWNVSLSSYDLLYLYGMTTIMARMEYKLFNELRPGSKVISNIFRFPHWKPKKIANDLTLYIKK